MQYQSNTVGIRISTEHVCALIVYTFVVPSHPLVRGANGSNGFEHRVDRQGGTSGLVVSKSEWGFRLGRQSNTSGRNVLRECHIRCLGRTSGWDVRVGRQSWDVRVGTSELDVRVGRQSWMSEWDVRVGYQGGTAGWDGRVRRQNSTSC